jgi:hypothetical protein
MPDFAKGSAWEDVATGDTDQWQDISNETRPIGNLFVEAQGA